MGRKYFLYKYSFGFVKNYDYKSTLTKDEMVITNGQRHK